MLRATSLVLLTLLICACVSLAQTYDDLGKCNARNAQLEQWYAENKTKYDQLLADNVRLEKENDELAEQDNAKNGNRGIFLAFVFGLGATAAYLTYRGIKKVWPPSSQHKQLAVLMLAAVWIVVASLIAIAVSPHASVSMTKFRALIYSLPGVLFGGIGFWWFGRRVVVRLF